MPPAARIATRSHFLETAIAAGAAATLTTTAALVALGYRRDASPWAPLNAVSHILWGRTATMRARPSVKYTATGAALNAAAVASWAALYAGLVRRRPPSPGSALAAGAITAATAYVVDYAVVPKRLMPGFETRLTPSSMFLVYASLAAGLAAGSWLRRKATY